MLAHVEREIPTDRFIEFKNKAADEIEDFSVSFIFNSELYGSGTLVDISGTLGVLTAHHVVAPTLDCDKEGTFGLNIAKHLHQFEIPRECIEHVPIGHPAKLGSYTESGPDLSFLELSGEPICLRLRAKSGSTELPTILWMNLVMRIFKKHPFGGLQARRCVDPQDCPKVRS